MIVRLNETGIKLVSKDCERLCYLPTDYSGRIKLVVLIIAGCDLIQSRSSIPYAEGVAIGAQCLGLPTFFVVRLRKSNSAMSFPSRVAQRVTSTACGEVGVSAPGGVLELRWMFTCTYLQTHMKGSDNAVDSILTIGVV
jgi:hypothetical protein